LTFRPILDRLVEEDVFDHELKELMLQMKQQILEVLLPFISFLYIFERRKGHNMLALVLDPRFKSMRLVTMFMGHEDVTFVIVEYDEKLLIFLLMEIIKFLMFGKVEIIFDFHSEVNFEGILHITSLIVETYKDIVSKELVGFQQFPLDVKGYKCALSWWHKEEHKFLTISLLAHHIISIPTAKSKQNVSFPLLEFSLHLMLVANREFGQAHFCQQKLGIRSTDQLYETN
jgi:hypothetical protein